MTVTIDGQKIKVSSFSLVSNSVGIYTVDFTFTGWDGWSKTAVFQLNDERPIEVVIVDNKCDIPTEVLKENGSLKIGVYGTKEEKVMPTIWTSQLRVKVGTPTGQLGKTPTPSVYAQILSTLDSKLSDAPSDDKKYARKNGAWVEITGGGTLPFETIGENLKVVNGALCVDTAPNVEQDNTKPITSAAVYVEIGNINSLLALI